MEEDKKVWIMLRISFWAMVGFTILIYIFPILWYSTPIYLTYYVLFIIGSIIFTFVTSLIHLRRYKQKGFAITALVISSLYLLYNLFFIFMGMVMAMMGLV